MAPNFHILDEDPPVSIFTEDGDLPEGWVCMPKVINDMEQIDSKLSSICLFLVAQVMMVDSIEYKTETQCIHEYKEECFDTFKTLFKTVEVNHRNLRLSKHI